MPRLYTTEEIAKHFGVTVETVQGWVRKQRIPCVRPSRRIIRFNLDDVEKTLTHPVRTRSIPCRT